jgi:hypothetical protein
VFESRLACLHLERVFAKIEIFPINKKKLEEFDPNLPRPHDVCHRARVVHERIGQT